MRPYTTAFANPWDDPLVLERRVFGYSLMLLWFTDFMKVTENLQFKDPMF